MTILHCALQRWPSVNQNKVRPKSVRKKWYFAQFCLERLSCNIYRDYNLKYLKNHKICLHFHVIFTVDFLYCKTYVFTTFSKIDDYTHVLQRLICIWKYIKNVIMLCVFVQQPDFFDYFNHLQYYDLSINCRFMHVTWI